MFKTKNKSLEELYEYIYESDAIRALDDFGYKLTDIVDDLAFKHAKKEGHKTEEGMTRVMLEDVQYAGNRCIEILKREL